MALIQLTHPEEGYELWLDPSEIVVMERYMRKKSAVLTLVDDKPDVTALVFKNGKIMSCKETPKEVLALAAQNS